MPNSAAHLDQIRSAMATFDNPSYFTMAGQSPVLAEADSPSIGTKPKRFKSWFKLKRPFKTKVTSSIHDEPDPDNRSKQTSPEPHHAEQELQGTETPSSAGGDFGDVVYYNFCSAKSQQQVQGPLTAADDDVINDDVFSDTSTTVGGAGSVRNLHRRRHSLGSWFRSSLAAAVRKQNAVSTASGLESGATDRPSTSSERALLPSRAVSSSVHCVSYRSTRDVRTPETARWASSNSNGCSGGVSVSSGTEVKARRSRLPVVVKSHVELRARARYARQEKVVRDVKAASTSRIPRPVHQHQQQTTSLDRRYTNSTEVLTSKSEENSSAAVVSPTAASQRNGDENQQPEAVDQFRQMEDSSCANRRKSISSSTTSSSRHRLIQRSRTIEERQRSSCCGRMAAASASSSASARAERRRASLETTTQGSSNQNRRRCQRCRDKVEPVDAEKVDVVIIFSKNCVVAYQWITYLTEVINNIFSSQDRPPTRVTSRDVESLVNCGVQPPTTYRRVPNQSTQALPHPPVSDGNGNNTFQRSEYQNEIASEQLEAERNARQHAVRKTVSTASLQVVLLSKSLLNHIGLHANDPLGQLLHPKRVIGLMLGLNELKDITELHISALYSFAYWPKVTMLDQDMKSVTEFRALAQEILNRSQPAALTEARLQPARFKITPRKLRSGEERVTLILLETVENIQSLSSVYVGIESKKNPICVDKLSWLNPYTATFSVPKEFLERGIIVKVLLKVDGNSWGSRDLKCQSKLGEIALLLTKSQLIGSPIDIMCQALNISPADHNALDTVLAQNLNKKNIPSSAFKFENASANEPSEEEFPTLLHFASRYGFERLLWTLLECPAACEALNVRNVHGMTPIDQAKTHGHDVIVNNLQSFLDVLSIFEKQTSKSNADLTNDEDGYVDMNPSDKENPSASDNYDFLPKPKPINSVAGSYVPVREIPQVNEPISENDNELNEENPYLVVLPQNGSIQQDDLEEKGAVGLDQSLLRNPGSPSPGSKHRSCTDELREIISEVKSQRLDVRQAAIAFEAWKQRKDVQEDSDKRKEILIRMIEAHRKPEKVGFFKRMFLGKAQSPIKNIEENETVPDGGWSSSDRSSVTSHLSHDSGAHSDSQEERKVVPNIQNDYDVPLPMESSLKMLNYLVPPAPRPIGSEKGTVHLVDENLPPRPPGRFQTPLQKFSPPLHFEFPNRFETIELNPPQSQGTTGEDLGHISPDEEPYVFEQMSILPPVSSSKDQELWTSLNKAKETTQAVLGMDADYMDMTPKTTRKEYGKLTETIGSQIDDDYVTASELNMPLSNQLHGTGNSTQQKTAPWFSSEVKIEQQFRLERPISNSANQLLSIFQEETLKTEWRSDPSLTMIKTPPTKPRRHIPLNHIPQSSSPVVLPRPLPRSKPVKLEGMN